jgi:hypothetical protein
LAAKKRKIFLKMVDKIILLVYYVKQRRKKMKKQFSLIFVLFVFVGTMGLFGLGNKDHPDFLIANGTGSTIKKIQIVPSAEKYPNSGKEFNLNDVKLEDTGVLSIYLPDDMKRYDMVDITIQCGWRKFNTKQSVNISKSFFGKPPMFDFSKKGKDSTFLAATGAAAGGAIAVGGIGSVFLTGVATNGAAAYVTWALAGAGSVVGGGMAAGVAVVAAIPLAAAAVVGGIVWGISGLIPGELVVKSTDYKTN